MRTFYKYSGAGNDFILFEDFEKDFPANQIQRLCHRRLGIGADGLILAHHSTIADFEMTYFNADGSRGEMCGNGLRCFVHFLRDLKFQKTTYKIEVSQKVLTVKCKESKISVFLPLPSKSFCVVDSVKGYKVDTGVPHLVLFTEEEVDVQKMGKALRHHKLFQPEGTNVNFATVVDDNTIHIRTFERGVEAETLACGTGAVAVAYVAKQLGKCGNDVRLVTRSKEVLEVRFGKEIEITGPSEKIFEGHVTI